MEEEEENSELSVFDADSRSRSSDLKKTKALKGFNSDDEVCKWKAKDLSKS